MSLDEEQQQSECPTNLKREFQRTERVVIVRNCVSFVFSLSLVFKKAFAMFDSGKTGSIEKEKVRTILNTLGHTYDDSELSEMLDAEDVDGEISVSFLQLWRKFRLVQHMTCDRCSPVIKLLPASSRRLSKSFNFMRERIFNYITMTRLFPTVSLWQHTTHTKKNAPLTGIRRPFIK